MKKADPSPDFNSVTQRIRARAAAVNLWRIWRTRPDRKKAVWVRPLMRVGHSNVTAAETLRLTEGQIAGVRFRQKISSRNASGFEQKTKASGGAKRGRDDTGDQVRDFLRWRRNNK